MSRLEVSVVAPFFNELEALPSFCTELRRVMDSLGCIYEVLLVDDGSSDGGAEHLQNSLDWPECSVIRLATNVGHQNALDAGLHTSVGAWVITMDADLQHPPSIIPRMLEIAMYENVSIVYGIQKDRSDDSFFKRSTATAYYKIMRAITGVNLIPHAADFRLLSADIVRILNALPEEKVFRLLIPSLGYPFASVYYKASKRVAGHSKYSLIKMVKLALRSIITFSVTPLRWVVAVGLVTSFIAFCWLLGVVIAFSRGLTVSGWTSVMAAVLFLGGLQILALGTIGEYLANLVALSKNRARYAIRDINNLTSKPPHEH